MVRFFVHFQLLRNCLLFSDELDEQRKETERQRDVDDQFIKEHSLEKFVNALMDKDEANKEMILTNVQGMMEAIESAESSATEYIEQLIDTENEKYKRVLELSDSLDKLLN